jgi:predicted transcriptional regulator
MLQPIDLIQELATHPQVSQTPPREHLLWLRPDESVEKAAKLMAFHNVGLIPVCDGSDRATGVVTDRDIALRVAAANLPARETRLADVMSKDLQVCAPDDSVTKVEEIMTRAGVSRVLVVDPWNGRLQGLISLVDITAGDLAPRALRTARKIVAREQANRRLGMPRHADDPQPEYFHGSRESTSGGPTDATQRASAERDVVIRGGSSGMKEFGG